MNSQPLHNNEVVSEKPTRRYFYAKDKSRLLLEADSASPDQLGALLRREGIFSTDLDAWRKERNKGLLNTSSKKKGRPITVDPVDGTANFAARFSGLRLSGPGRNCIGCHQGIAARLLRTHQRRRLER